MCRDERGPHEGKDRAENFHQMRQPPLRKAVPEDDEDRHQILQDRGRRRIAVLDGRKISVLRPDHSQHAKDQDPYPVFFILPDRPDARLPRQ